MEIASDWDKHPTFYVQYVARSFNSENNTYVDLLSNKGSISNDASDKAATSPDPEKETLVFRSLPPLAKYLKTNAPNIRIEYDDENDCTPAIQTTFVAPTEELSFPQALCCTVSQDGKHLAAGGRNGTCEIIPLVNGSLCETEVTRKSNLEGHLDDVTCLKFFPSSKVLLSGGSDFAVKIWEVDENRGAVKAYTSLTGHFGTITGLGIIERAAATDGMLKLWSCAHSQSSITHWNLKSCINDIAILSHHKSHDEENPNSENEYGTEGKIAIAALENGGAAVVDIRSRRVQHVSNSCSDPITAVAAAYSANNMFYTGSETGLVSCWDMRYLDAPLIQMSRNSLRVTSLAATLNDHSPSLWAASSGGTCCKWEDLKTVPKITTEVTGPAYDPIRDVALLQSNKIDGSGTLWTSCRDGILRNYQCSTI